MGLASSCFLSSSPSMVKLIFWGGTTQLLLPDNHLAADILIKNPDKIICHADSFYIGRPIPVLSLDDNLIAGQTYFVLPVDCFPCTTSNLTTASLASLSSSKRKPGLFGSGQFPFEYVKSGDGRMLIKVMPEFIERIVSAAADDGCDEGRGRGSMTGTLCSTPELMKQYEQLVGPRERPWSPKLETITERKPRSSPVRLLGL